MKIKEGFIIKKVNEYYIVILENEKDLDFSGIITLNGSGKLLFESLKENKTKEELVNLLLDNYEVTYEKALSDTEAFINVLEKHQLLV